MLVDIFFLGKTKEEYIVRDAKRKTYCLVTDYFSIFMLELRERIAPPYSHFFFFFFALSPVAVLWCCQKLLSYDCMFGNAGSQKLLPRAFWHARRLGKSWFLGLCFKTAKLIGQKRNYLWVQCCVIAALPIFFNQ